MTQLPCAACGGPAFAVAEEGAWIDEPVFLCEQPLGGIVIPRSTLRHLAQLMSAGRLSDLDDELRNNGTEGLVGYCGNCDAIYCEQHLTFDETWSGGFRTVHAALCPHGHRRMIERDFRVQI